MRKGYFGAPGQQVHYRECGSGGTPLMCLPPAPHTGAYFETVMPLLAQKRQVKAVDYPGYGGSDRLEGEPSIAAYARRLSSEFNGKTRLDLIGFHTGNLVALEIALLHPNAVQNIIMIDVPFFDAETRKTYRSKLPPTGLPSPVEASFDKTVTQRHRSTDENRAFALWTETMRSGRYQGDAFRAAFSYNCETQFPKLDHAVTIIATQSGLLGPSRKAASVLPNAALVETLDITAPVFEAYSEAIAEVILDA